MKAKKKSLKVHQLVFFTAYGSSTNVHIKQIETKYKYKNMKTV